MKPCGTVAAQFDPTYHNKKAHNDRRQLWPQRAIASKHKSNFPFPPIWLPLLSLLITLSLHFQTLSSPHSLQFPLRHLPPPLIFENLPPTPLRPRNPYQHQILSHRLSKSRPLNLPIYHRTRSSLRSSSNFKTPQSSYAGPLRSI